MTITEFKAFLEGMDVQGQPTAEQWARIKEKIDALASPPVYTPPVSVPTIYPREPLQPQPYWGKPYTVAQS